MSERDTDIEFDFFDDPETRETAPTQRVRMPKRGPRRPTRPPAGVTPLLRLAGLIAFAILIVVLLVFWISSCRSASKHKSYSRYMEKVALLGQESAQTGKELNDLLTTPGVKQADLGPKLRGFVQSEVQHRDQAAKLDAPGPLRPEQQHVVEALELRVSGLSGLADTIERTAGSKDLAGTSDVLAKQAQRLLASDVVWADLFKGASVDELKRQGIGGVAVPGSSFLQNPDLGSARSWVPVLQRIRGAATGGTPGGLHGTGLISVKALPAGQQLSPTIENIIRATPDLAFEATVKDTGESQEVHIKVTLTIQKSTPVVKTQTIDLINPGESKTVVFRDLGQPDFAKKLTLKVDVQPVPGEKNTANNSAEYPFIFSAG